MHEIEQLKQRLASCEPVISETLADEVLRDVNVALTPCRFHARLHCTKKSRCRSTFLGILLGTSLGLLIGFTLPWVWHGSAGQQIVVVEVPVATPIPKQQPEQQTEQQPEQQDEQKPLRERPTRQYDATYLARAERQFLPVTDIDRLIDQTIAQRQQIQFPEGIGGQYAVPRLTAYHVSDTPDYGRMMLQRELLESFQ